jgi:hypothetical protein
MIVFLNHTSIILVLLFLRKFFFFFCYWQDSVYGDEVDDWVDPPIVPKCLSSELGTCLLKGRSCDITFAEYILKNSKAMHTMNVSAAAVDTFNKLQLIMCKKGSTTCKLSFDWEGLEHLYFGFYFYDYIN